MTNKIKVVGFDPSMSNFGIAMCRVDIDTLDVDVDELHLIKTEPQDKKTVIKTSDDLRRARVLVEEMHRLCKGHAFAISEIPLGNAAMYNNAILSAGIVTGVLASCPIPIIQVNPFDVKIAAVNHRQAAKEEMIEAAMARWPNANWRMRTLKGKQKPITENEHLADACFSVVAGTKMQEFKQAVALMKAMRG